MFVFANGCFWGSEKGVWRLPGGGIHSTAVGYAGGFTPNPTYEDRDWKVEKMVAESIRYLVCFILFHRISENIMERYMHYWMFILFTRYDDIWCIYVCVCTFNIISHVCPHLPSIYRCWTICLPDFKPHQRMRWWMTFSIIPEVSEPQVKMISING